MNKKRLLIPLVIVIPIITASFYAYTNRPKEFKAPFYGTTVKAILEKELDMRKFSFTNSFTQTGDTIEASISGVKIFFSAVKDPNAQVRALQLVLTEVKMKGKDPREIDLRYNKAVIRY